jgi:hypothetical protein
MRTIFSGVAKLLRGPAFVNVGIKDGRPEYWRYYSREQRERDVRYWPQCGQTTLYRINVYPK